jgi:hypothetical protein
MEAQFFLPPQCNSNGRDPDISIGALQFMLAAVRNVSSSCPFRNFSVLVAIVRWKCAELLPLERFTFHPQRTTREPGAQDDDYYQRPLRVSESDGDTLRPPLTTTTVGLD